MALESVSALILDDNAHMRGLLRVMLASFGMRQIDEAADTNEAFGMCASGDHDIVFVDFKLGGLDGIDFCRRIRRDPDSPNKYMPLVMVTAYDAPGARAVSDGGADLILVGDSVAMVVLGYDDTLQVTVVQITFQKIAHHQRR